MTDKSTNGTVVNGTILGKGNSYHLRSGDTIVVVPGAFEFRWKLSGKANTPTPDRGAPSAHTPGRGALGTPTPGRGAPGAPTPGLGAPGSHSLSATAREKTEMTSRTESQRGRCKDTRVEESAIEGGDSATARQSVNGTSVTEHLNSIGYRGGALRSPGSKLRPPSSASPAVMEEHSDTEPQESADPAASLTTRLAARYLMKESLWEDSWF